MNTVALLDAITANMPRHGLCPIPVVRDALGLPRAEFDRLVLAAERAGVVTIKVANQPRAEERPEDGVKIGPRDVGMWLMLD